MSKREAGRLGGRSTVAKYGRGYMREIGRKGFWATVNRHWSGDKEAFCRRLVQLGLMAQDPTDPFGGRLNSAWSFPELSQIPELPY